MGRDYNWGDAAIHKLVSPIYEGSHKEEQYIQL